MGSHADGWQQPLFFPFSPFCPRDMTRGEARRGDREQGLKAALNCWPPLKSSKECLRGYHTPFCALAIRVSPPPQNLSKILIRLLCVHTHIQSLFYSTLLYSSYQCLKIEKSGSETRAVLLVSGSVQVERGGREHFDAIIQTKWNVIDKSSSSSL